MEEKQKAYVIDTNALLKNSKLFEDERFKDGQIYIPMVVIQELDYIKSDQKRSDGNLKFKARTASKEIEKNLKDENVKILKSNDENKDICFSTYEVMDDLIISSALHLNKEKTVILVSSDLNVRLKGEGVGLLVENYSTENVNTGVGDMYSGVIETKTDGSIINAFYQRGRIEWQALTKEEPYPNEFIIAENECNEKQKIVARYIKKTGCFEKLKYGENNFWGDFKAKDIYQKFAIELLMDDDVKIVTISAPQGSGKTFLGVGSMLELVSRDKYSKLLIGKDTTPINKWAYQG